MFANLSGALSALILIFFLLQIFIEGNSAESFLIAIIVVNLQQLQNLLKIQDSESHAMFADSEALNNDAVRLPVFAYLQEFGKISGLSGLEQIRNFHLIREEFSMDAGLLTPTLKLRRSKLRQTFANEIRELYANGPL